MATVTPQGIIPTTLTEYVELLNGAFTSVFGSNINLDPETPEGQLIGLLAFSLSQLDESVIDTANASNINKAMKQQLDALMSYLRIARSGATATEVDVQLTGVPVTFIPEGSRARDTAGSQFTLQSNVTLNAQGNGTGVMVCTITGPVPVAANSLNQIVDVIPGWESINNSNAGEEGQNQETDYQYFNRYEASVKMNANSPIGAVKAALLALPTMQRAEVTENDRGEPQSINGYTLKAHSLIAVVKGGTDAEVATAIGQKKSSGCDTNGGSSYPYIDPSSPVPKIIHFERVTEVSILMDIEIRINRFFPANGLQMMRDNLLTYFEGSIDPDATTNFAGQGIGENVIWSRLFIPLNLVPGHEVLSLQITKVGGLPSPVDIPISLTEIAVLTMNNIDIVVVN